MQRNLELSTKIYDPLGLKGFCLFIFCDFTALTTPVPIDPDAGAVQQGAGGLKNKTLWIVIAAVAGITLIAIIIISVILCKKRSGDDIQR